VLFQCMFDNPFFHVWLRAQPGFVIISWAVPMVMMWGQFLPLLVAAGMLRAK